MLSYYWICGSSITNDTSNVGICVLTCGSLFPLILIIHQFVCHFCSIYTFIMIYYTVVSLEEWIRWFTRSNSSYMHHLPHTDCGEGDEPSGDAGRHLPCSITDDDGRVGHKSRPCHLLPQWHSSSLWHLQEHSRRRPSQTGQYPFLMIKFIGKYRSTCLSFIQQHCITN